MDWQSLLIAASVGLAALLTAAFSGLRLYINAWFVKHVKKLNRATYVRQIEKVSNFLQVLDECKLILEVDSILVYQGHNCGGLPSPGRPYTTRAIHGWRRDGKDPLKRYGFDNQVDLHAVKMLEDMIKVGVSFQVFEDMPKDAKLRSYFAAEGTKFARLYFLGLADSDMIFMSFASYTVTFSETDIENMLVLVDKMRSLLELE